MAVRATAARAPLGGPARDPVARPGPIPVPPVFPAPVPVQYPDGTLLRGQSLFGIVFPQVEMIQAHERRAIPDTQTFNYMGLNPNSVQTVPIVILTAIPAGPPFPSRADETLLKGSGPAIYLMGNGSRHLIPDPATFNAMGLNWGDVASAADADVNAIPLGAPVPEGGVGVVHPAFPITASQDDNFPGSGGFMHTDVSIYADGSVNAVTHTWEVTDLRGFRGAVAVAALDHNQNSIWVSQTQHYGVDGRWIGTSDRTDAWSDNIPSNILPNVRYVAIIQHWDPNLVEDIENWIQGIGNIAQQLGPVIKAVELVISLL